MITTNIDTGEPSKNMLKKVVYIDVKDSKDLAKNNICHINTFFLLRKNIHKQSLIHLTHFT